MATEHNVAFIGAFRRGEFDRVVYQVCDDLSKAERITDELVGNVRIDVVSEVQVAIARTDDQGFKNSEDGLSEQERNLLHGHPTSFH